MQKSKVNRKIVLVVIMGIILIVMVVLHISTNRIRKNDIIIKENPKLLSEPAKINLLNTVVYEQNQSGILRRRLVDEKTLREKEEGIYTFLQGPRAWREEKEWSGEWCEMYVNGNTFGNFGCGLCCMANIYSTLSGRECSPVDMYNFARMVTSYYPTAKNGAISWQNMERSLQKTGFSCELRQKPSTYEEFKQQVKQSATMIVLVSSYEDDSFWKNTGGHYVNIWLYNDRTGEVFLAEPGDPENNRSRIPLEYIYKALKMRSDYQYLTVMSYNENENIWKFNGIDDNWKSPIKE